MSDLLLRAQRNFHAACGGLLKDLVDSADDALFELAAASNDDDCQRAAFDLARALHVHRDAFIDRFTMLLAGEEEGPELALRAEPEHEDARLATRAVVQFGLLLTRVAACYTAEAGFDPDVSPVLLPIAPAQVAAAYRGARTELAANAEEARYLDTLFVRLVVERLGREYATFYACLAPEEEGRASA